MGLVKMEIVPERDKGIYGEGFEVLFNPNRLSYSKHLTWSARPTVLSAKANAKPRSQLNHDEPAFLTVPLFFDTYEGAPGPLAFGRRSVLDHTKKIQMLTEYLPEAHRPPVCKLIWGRATAFEQLLFKGVLRSLEQNFLLFLEDGTPVRAELNCTFMEYTGEDDNVRGELHSADVSKKYVVKPGDTLINVAANLYRDASLWRAIATANGIEDPRALSPGQILDVPPLR